MADAVRRQPVFRDHARLFTIADVEKFSGKGRRPPGLRERHGLGTWVRDRQVMSLERAVQRLTSEPAQIFGLADRGVIAAGKAADLVIFDPGAIAAGDKEMLYDLPGGEGRFVQRAEGIHWVVVNGSVLFADGGHSGVLPGQVLQAGR